MQSTGRVLLRPGEELSVEALRDWAGPRLADYKQPAELVTVGQLPRNANGKVMKKQLAGEPAAEEQVARRPPGEQGKNHRVYAAELRRTISEHAAV